MKTLKTYLNKMIHIGVDITEIIGERRQIVLLNTLSIFFFIIILIFFIISIYRNYTTTKEIFSTSIIFFIAMIFITFILFFNSKKYYLFSRIYTCIISTTVLTLLTFNVGRDYFHHLYYLPLIIVIFFIFPHKQRFYIYAWIGIIFFLTLGLEIWFIDHKPIAIVPGHFSNQIRLVNITGLFLLLTGTGYYAYSIIRTSEEKLNAEYEKSENLLLNILPKEIADELKIKGSIEPTYFESVSVMFTDFKGFTKVAEDMSPRELVAELDHCFSYFDSLMDRFNMEKLKTIGDSFMCAGGIPKANKTHAIDAIMTAIEILYFMDDLKKQKVKQNTVFWELRIGIHTGPLVAGVIGDKKFAYDVWSDTVNTASRCESSGAVNKINITEATYNLVKEFFNCEHRGFIPVKNKEDLEMYYVTGIKDELSLNGDGRTPNNKFLEHYNNI